MSSLHAAAHFWPVAKYACLHHRLSWRLQLGFVGRSLGTPAGREGITEMRGSGVCNVHTPA